MPVALKSLIDAAIVALKERTGSSRQAILKFICAKNDLSSFSPQQLSSAVNRILKAGAAAGTRQGALFLIPHSFFVLTKCVAEFWPALSSPVSPPHHAFHFPPLHVWIFEFSQFSVIPYSRLLQANQGQFSPR
jgi:hypothetical protein